MGLTMKKRTYGTPNNCELIWKKGDLLPTAPKDIFE